MKVTRNTPCRNCQKPIGLTQSMQRISLCWECQVFQGVSLTPQEKKYQEYSLQEFDAANTAREEEG